MILRSHGLRQIVCKYRHYFPFTLISHDQFQVLFNSLCRVLFTFPSRYLWTIGIRMIFSLRRCLPPVFSMRFKTYLLWDRKPTVNLFAATDGILTHYENPFSKDLNHKHKNSWNASIPHTSRELPGSRDSRMGSSRFTRSYSGNHFYFLFLRLLICLNLTGFPTSFELLIRPVRRGSWTFECN